MNLYSPEKQFTVNGSENTNCFASKKTTHQFMQYADFRETPLTVKQGDPFAIMEGKII